MENIKEQFARLYMELDLTDDQAAMIKKLQRDVEAALRQPLVSGELNCEHDWLVDMYDHFGFPASRFCYKCNTREAI